MNTAEHPMTCGRTNKPCGNDPKLWCRDCPNLYAAAGRQLWEHGTGGENPLLSALSMPPPPAVPPSGAHGAPLAYQVGVNQLFDVLIDWQHAVRHVALTPAQAVALAGSLKRVANLALAAKRKAQRAELLGAQLRAKLAEKMKGGAATDE